MGNLNEKRRLLHVSAPEVRQLMSSHRPRGRYQRPARLLGTSWISPGHLLGHGGDRSRHSDWEHMGGGVFRHLPSRTHCGEGSDWREPGIFRGLKGPRWHYPRRPPTMGNGRWASRGTHSAQRTQRTVGNRQWAVGSTARASTEADQPGTEALGDAIRGRGRGRGRGDECHARAKARARGRRFVPRLLKATNPDALARPVRPFPRPTLAGR
ncbi:hypothetical protein F4802DRAFT_573856 [Xylaria palmicola]|nr:hypothetical protein F4802DRAFT_573856 [Xylaria palmicola]